LRLIRPGDVLEFVPAPWRLCRSATWKSVSHCLLMLVAMAANVATPSSLAQSRERPVALDARVQGFLDRERGEWHDLNVPYEDGQALHDLIVKKGFTRGLEIGTSTGHSAIWIAWAMSKTGGKLITIEIDKARHEAALENFEEAGVTLFIDARLADAHQLVKELPGPFDFVFSDADKDWYTEYFKALEAKLVVGGCFTAHNVLDGFAGVDDFLAYVRSRTAYSTTIEHTSRSGLSVSCGSR
jgi:predicted O-methyltransferase YrrM